MDLRARPSRSLLTGVLALQNYSRQIASVSRTRELYMVDVSVRSRGRFEQGYLCRLLVERNKQPVNQPENTTTP